MAIIPMSLKLILLSSHSSLTLQQHFSRALMFRLLVLVTDTYLGAAISTRSFTEEYVSKKVKLRCDEIFTLSTIAKTYPHSAYGTFVHGILHKWNYVMRTIDSVGSLFQPLENVIHQHFIPALTGQDPCSGLEWELLALPCRLGGLNIPNPTTVCEFQFSASKRISAPLASLILQQSDEFSIPCLHSVKFDIHQA